MQSMGFLQDIFAQSENMQLLFNCIPTKADTSAFDTEHLQGINVSTWPLLGQTLD